MEIVATMEFKKPIVNAYIVYIIVGKLRYWEKPSLVILLIINKNPKISFYYMVLPFNLAVKLRIKGSKWLLLDLQKKLK